MSKDELGPQLSEHHPNLGGYIMGTPLCALVAIASAYMASVQHKKTEVFVLCALLFAAGAVALAVYGLRARDHRVFVFQNGLRWNFGTNTDSVRFRDILSVRATELNGTPVLLNLETRRGPVHVPLAVTDRDQLIDRVTTFARRG